MKNTTSSWSLALVLSSVVLAGCGSEALPGDDANSAASQYDVSDVQLAATAGVSGTVWVLESYGDGTAHPGLNAVDYGAPGGSNVYHQIEGLPAEIGGGWIFVDFVQEAGYCSQFNPGDAKYNGAKLRVHTYFYGRDGAYLGYHSAAYQHVVPADGIKDVWLTWNNANAGSMWSSPDATLGNRDGGGVFMGTLFAGGGVKITNNNGKLCHWGDHLHQEGMGSRASIGVGDKVTGRVSQGNVFTVAGGQPYSGNPPSAPPAVGTQPPADPQDPPATPQDPPGTPGDPDPTGCACKAGVDNFCNYAAKTAGCEMTQPGGYCDPNGNGDYADADWTQGWYDYKAKCVDTQPPAEEDPPAEDPPAASCACKAGVSNFCHYAPKTEGCAMTFPGGYCDPNGDGSYADGDWNTGWYEFNGQCGS
jgi:hypothetical protein